jgi:outer membrane murein-binding lipoprotein Lpp
MEMKKLLTFLVVALLLVLAGCSQNAPDLEIESQKLSSPAYDTASDVVANSSDIYVAGSTDGRVAGSTSSGGVFLRQYTVAGKPIWTKQFGPSNSYGARLALAPNGDVYVLSNTFMATKGISLRKYSKAGVLLWSRAFGNTTVDLGSAVDLELRGSTLYALASKNRANGFVVYRFNTSGTALSTIIKTDTSVSQAIDLTFDQKGNMIIATKTGFIDSNTAGIKILRYAPNGQQNGAIAVDTSSNDLASKVVVDSKNNLYIAWSQLGATLNVTSYDTNFRRLGNSVLRQAFGTQPFSADISDMTLAKNDSLYVVGRTNSAFGDYDNAGGNDGYLLVLNTTGGIPTPIFGETIRYGSPRDDSTKGVAVSSKVFVVGNTAGNLKSAAPAAGGSDAFIVTNRFEWFDQ